MTQGGGDAGQPAGVSVSGRAGATSRGALPEIPDIPDPDRSMDLFNPSGGRNLFAYGQPKVVAAPPPPPPVSRPAPPPPKVEAPPVQTAAGGGAGGAQVAAEPPKPTPPPLTFKFVGYLGPQQSLIGVFNVTTPDGDVIVLAREGEVLAEKFRVHRIGYEEVEIGYTQEPFLDERKVLPMGGRS
jgi:hypothetical protein